ncbi:sll0787 family AIR synthase-like protein [Zobellia roscoffensis]|uniref:sll0787 family AIR synthase-like protein n=1 Tax=Zobellia roscoffensis TaxID=2779508 RepID=UPI00188C1018|nr:sll0787 family AIR synthase-like protein [Zobellia roscoffensis]
MTSNTISITPILEKLRQHPDIKDKRRIAQTYEHIGSSIHSSTYFPEEFSSILLGDDTAVIPQKDGSNLLLAAEGIVPYFLDKDPWFAGYSAVMVNISDICAMGGLPIAVTDTLYTKDAKDSLEIWQGMLAASKAYGVPIVGGHTCYHMDNRALSVSILGKATENVLTSFNAKPGESILLAIDQNGAYYKDYAFWNASTMASSKELQEKAKIPHLIANEKWSSTAKDVSMGGIIGTICMLLNTSEVGAKINLQNITKPAEIAWEKWLSSFPSYGYILTCSSENITSIQSVFSDKGVTCDCIGRITKKTELIIEYEDQKIKF